ncbi:putative magnesium transporter [Burkholderia pseudomallei 406e]|nr:putative magnesium transporter [Burkholderia pseudomallei 1106a]EDO88112.1 putative magnesium transporter [Burkholderia pseudomallei 406e]EEH24916.1 putative magnesium transporter [Burkholderia pseudomallei Pakistan 9]EEP50938.1 MgtC family membrane protein [Burkholderia pseudomallei MSHR346]EES22615.1 putative magnesium transporter [Burkholderia pseudomallei 1106b]
MSFLHDRCANGAASARCALGRHAGPPAAAPLRDPVRRASRMPGPPRATGAAAAARRRARRMLVTGKNDEWWRTIMINHVELLGRLLLAALLGSVIGFERERMNWAAGLRTHMLVSVGSALVMLVSAFGFADVQGRAGVVLDPSRVAAQVVSGIGFLGAGSILLRGEVIRGLTTAASLWAVAGIGLATGGGMYVGAIGATAILLMILAGLKPLERRFIAPRQQRRVRLVVERGGLTLDQLHDTLGHGGIRVKQFIVQQSDDDPDVDDVSIALSRASVPEFAAICRKLENLAGVLECRPDIQIRSPA